MPFPDANFFVWRRGLRGAEPSIELMDPRTLPDYWKATEHRTIAVIPLTNLDRGLQSLEELVARHPCPEQAS